MKSQRADENWHAIQLNNDHNGMEHVLFRFAAELQDLDLMLHTLVLDYWGQRAEKLKTLRFDVPTMIRKTIF